jgi:membrane-associated phospholipid phosphatase
MDIWRAWRFAGAVGILAQSALPMTARAGDALAETGDVLQIALPVAAAVCAARQHRFASYATGLAALTAVTEGFKYGLGNTEINQRPNGQSHGFPSGHTAAAASGATDLAVHCAPGNRVVAATGAAAVALVAGSRIRADEHTLLQVVAGAAFGALSTGVGVYETPAGGIGFSYSFPF